MFMSGRKYIVKLMVLALASMAVTFAASGQDPQEPQQQDAPAPGKPKPAARGIPSISDPDSTIEDQSRTPSWQPDDSPATGLQVPGLGAPELAHSYWVPGLEYGSTIQSRPLGQQATSGWYANNYVGGNLSLLESWGRSQLALNYSGGGFFSTSSQLNSGTFQQLSFGSGFNLGRWQIQLFDYFSYLPDSQFGFANGTNLALPGISGALGPTIASLGLGVLPSQSIYAAVGPRYSNAGVAQATYLFSPRSSITAGGSYGLLHFTQSGNVDSDMSIGSIGYNYAVNRNDSIGVVYRFTGYHYAGEPQALGNHVVNFVYARKISQRLAMSLSAGPQITTYRVPIGTQTQDISASGGATLNYAIQRGGIGVSYFHGLSNGGGELVGSNMDQVSSNFTHGLGRVWTLNANLGYSHNTQLPGLSNSQSFNDWYVGGGVSRPFGRNVDFAVSYSARFESSNASTCSGPGCNTDYTQNLVSLSLQWHTRPFVLP